MPTLFPALCMLLDVVIVIFGFVGLIWGADKFVAGASAIAFNFGVAPLMIGLTIVAFGTSAPEFFSSAVAAIENQAPHRHRQRPWLQHIQYWGGAWHCRPYSPYNASELTSKKRVACLADCYSRHWHRLL